MNIYEVEIQDISQELVKELNDKNLILCTEITQFEISLNQWEFLVIAESPIKIYETYGVEHIKSVKLIQKVISI